MGVTGPAPDTGSADPSDVATVAGEIDALPTPPPDPSDDVSAVTDLESWLLSNGQIDTTAAQELIDAAQDGGGVTDAERRAFVDLLRQHGDAITPAALALLAQHFGVPLGRPAPPAPPPTPTPLVAGDLTLTPDQSDQTLRGTAKPGDVVEAINLSTAPNKRLHLDNTTPIATADAQGNFSGTIPDMEGGDVIRMRTRHADGTADPWLTIHAAGLPPRTRNAELNVDRTNLTANPDGTVDISQLTNRPITEPGAQVRFVNTRTGETFDMTASDDGGVPQGYKLKGRAGDAFTAAVSDGTYNTDFSTISGTLTAGGGAVDAGPEPGLVSDDKGYHMVEFHGPLFQPEGPDEDDVKQGAIGDCYFPATIAAIAAARPDVIKDMIKDNGNGTYTVRFYKNGDGNRPESVTVDNKLYVRSSGTPLYGEADDTPDTPERMEMWFPILEKAYAEWKGGYDGIGHGGVPANLMGEVMGQKSQSHWLPANASTVFAQLKDAVAKHQPIAAATFGDDREALYTDTGVYADHTYSILGTKEENGKKLVVLRNPWGESVPDGEEDPRGDGIFDMPVEQFVKLYSSFAVGGS